MEKPLRVSTVRTVWFGAATRSPQTNAHDRSILPTAPRAAAAFELDPGKARRCTR